MISNQILLNTIEGLKSITRIDMCVMDTEGKVLATTFSGADEYESAVVAFVESPADSQLVSEFQFFKVSEDNQLEYILLAKGGNDDVYMVGKMAAFQIQSLLVAYKERYDKDNFIKNLLLDNMLLVDIYSRAKKLHIDTDVRRVVFIIETKNEKDTNALETIRGLFSTKSKDFITAVDEKNIILVKEVGDTQGYDDMDKIARTLLDMSNSEAMAKVNVAYGTIVSDIKEVSKSFKEAKLALDVGKIFYSDKNVVAYNSLGIGRLIYQLPMPLCKMFIKEIFDGKSPDEFDEETLSTINKFFENSLNVSETSRQLYIHRNTLVYRLDKLQKSTNLDLRIFDDENGVMNKSLLEVGGDILSISQFTLYADTNKGKRPSYVKALSGDKATILYDLFNKKLSEFVHVETGIFGADMLVNIQNDGPITIMLER